jgi:hypothetical protein
MNSKIHVVLLLGLLVAASIDQVPDPPVLNPHAASVLFLLPEASSTDCERVRIDGFSALSDLQIRWVIYAFGHEPSVPRDQIIVTGYAADPSPPFPATPHNGSLHS